MSAIGKGDWVECISHHAEKIGLRAGAAYLVEEVRDMGRDCSSCRDACKRMGLRLSGATPIVQGYAVGFVCSSAFRPIYRPKSTFIETLKQPAPDRELEDA